MSHKNLVIGTRGSALALRQAHITLEALRKVDPCVSVEVRVITTYGDIDQNPIPLDTVGKGWFTKEIENALINNEIDIAVHSLKDMAEDMPAGLHIGAYLAREDARDVLITKHNKSLDELPPNAVIGTDSARRQIQMLALRPDLRMKSLRGNIVTRLEKLDPEYDAIILASAGLKRLGLEQRITRYFTPTEMTPSPGQGILALQTRDEDPELRALLLAVQNTDATDAAHIERAFSRAVGGGCKSPTGAYAFFDGDECVVVGMLVDETHGIVRAQVRAPRDHSHGLGEILAQKLQAE